MATAEEGMHFYAKLLRDFGSLSGVYEYDDMKRKGKTCLVSENPMELSIREKLVVMAMYTLAPPEETFIVFSRKNGFVLISEYNLFRTQLFLLNLCSH